MKRILLFVFLLAALTLTGLAAFAEETTGTPFPGAEETPAPSELPGPDLRFSRDFSTRYAEVGDMVTLSYTVRNNSFLPVENVVVSDTLGGEVGRIERLESGEKKTLSLRVEVTQGCVSEPKISFEYDGETYTRTRTAESVYLANVRLRVELSADKTNVAPGETVTLRLKVVNEGNVNLYGLRAEEPVLGELGSLVAELPPGEECAVSRTVQMKNACTFQFSVSGTSDTGGLVTVRSNELSVLVTPVAAQIELGLRAEADRTELDGPGEVTFSLVVDNECQLELRNVTLSEEKRGEVRHLVFVPTGEMPVITQTYQVSESGVYRFLARMSDSVGDELTVFSEPIEITVRNADGETPVPEPSPTPAESSIPIMEGVSYRMEENPGTFEKLMLGATLTLLAILLIWYIAARVRRFKTRRKAKRLKKQKKLERERRKRQRPGGKK